MCRAAYTAHGLLLWNERLSRRPDSGNLNYHLTVLRPTEVRRLGRFRVERTSGIRLELALIPFVATTKVERSGQDYDCAHFIRMPMRRVLPAGRELDARDKHSRLCGVAVQHNGLRRTR